MSKLKIYFTSDLHLGHANSIKFDNRLFKNLEEMHRVLVENYNKVVPPEGLCYFLGDIFMMSTSEAASIINQLNGTKILIRGNHDPKMGSCLKAGFDAVLEKGQISIGKTIVTMSHCPLRGVYREDTTEMRGKFEPNWHGESKYGLKYSFEDFGQFHLHGHIHSPNRGRSERVLGRQLDVGVPANQYKPVKIGEIQSWIDRYKKESEK